MTYELEKAIAHLNSLLPGRKSEIERLCEAVRKAHGDVQRWLAEASAENARLRHENEQLRKRLVEG